MLKTKLNLILAAGVALAPLVQAAVRTPGEPTPLLTKRSEAQLLAVLKSDVPLKEKADACRELGVIGTKAAVPVLAGMLADETLSHMARYALEPNPDPSVDEALRAALGQLKGRPLVGVIDSIGVRRDAKATDGLAKLLQAAEADVAQAAARALGKIASAAAAQAIQNALPGTPAANQVAFCEGLLRCAEALAAAGQSREARAIYDQLRAAPSVPHQVRTAGVRGAILLRGFREPQVLQECLKDPDYGVFAAAVRATMEMPGPQVTHFFVQALTEGQPSADRKVLLLETLGPRATPNNQASIPLFAKDPDKAVRLAAVRAAPAAASDSAGWLVQYVDDPDRDIAQAAREGLASLPGPQIDQMVVAMLSEPARQSIALELISRRRMTSVIPALFNNVRFGEAQGRTTALKKIGELGGPAQLPELLKLLRELQKSDEVDAAEQALSAVCAKADDPGACLDQITAQLEPAKPMHKAALLRVLSAAGGPKALAAVRAGVKDANPEVRTAAIRALGDWKTADAAPDLLALAKTAADPKDKMLCLRSFLGLARNTDFPAADRLALCRQAAELVQSKDEKRLLLSALGSIQSPDSLALIAPYLDDASAKEEASAATVSIAERLLKGREAAKAAPKLIEPLRKASQATADADLASRAKTLLEQAQGKRGRR